MDEVPSSTPEMSIAAPPAPSGMRPIFLGPQGLRAGWRFAIYLAVVVVLTIGLAYAVRPLFPKAPGGTPRLWVFLFWESCSFLIAVVPALVFSRFENRPFEDYGLPPQRAFGKNFWAGVVWGLVAITCLLLMLRAAGVFYFGSIAIHGVHALKYGVFWAVMFTLVGLFEEFMTRGYTQFTLGQGIGFWPAAVLLSCTFGGLHLRQEMALGDPLRAWAGVLGAAFIGLFFCLTLRRTGTLWFAIGMHASWDWGESFLYSVPDSGTQTPGHLLNSSFHGNPWLTGGPIGPEASLLLFVLIGAMWLLFHRLYPAKQA